MIDNETVDNSIIQRDFVNSYHQPGANLNNPDRNIEFVFGENNNDHQIGIAYFLNDKTVRKAVTIPQNSNFLDTNEIKKLIK